MLCGSCGFPVQFSFSYKSSENISGKHQFSHEASFDRSQRLRHLRYLQTKCMTHAISGWNARLHSRVGRLCSCSASLLYYVVWRSSQRWRQSCTQSILFELPYLQVATVTFTMQLCRHFFCLFSIVLCNVLCCPRSKFVKTSLVERYVLCNKAMYVS